MRGRKPEDLKGQKFGRLVAEEYAGHLGGRSAWRCRCDCGNETLVGARHLKFGGVKSCGCLQKEAAHLDAYRALASKAGGGALIHGHSASHRTRNGTPSPTYNSWRNMIRRCEDPKNPRYRWYGAKGIKVCSRWRHSFINFLEDMGERPNGHSISRKDHDRDYEPSNCEWAPAYTH